jgi:hypothetical protein
MLLFWLQEESVHLKEPSSVIDVNAVIDTITTRDLQLTLECLELDDKYLYTCIGRTVQPK